MEEERPLAHICQLGDLSGRSGGESLGLEQAASGPDEAFAFLAFAAFGAPEFNYFR